jgi:ribosome-associated protein
MITDMTSQEKAELIAQAADEKKAENVVVLEVTPLTLMTDFFVICSGNSNVQLRAIADNILEKAKKAGIKDKRVEGYGPGGWILLDYGDVVVHIMMEEERTYYRLEDLWKEAAVVVGSLRDSDKE